MKKNRYQHLMVNALISIALFLGSLNAAYEDDIDEGLTNKLCRKMKAEKNRQEEVLNLIIQSIVDYITPHPPTLQERISTAATQVRTTFSKLLKNPH